MGTERPSKEMNFKAIIESLLSYPGDDSPALDEFAELIRSGCSEAEAKRWLGLHIWSFSEGVREQIVLALAADALHIAAISVDEEVRNAFVRIWKTQGYATARAWYERHDAANGDCQ